MHNWEQQLQCLLKDNNRVVMVTVVQTQGSTPREKGVKFFVQKASIIGTIGGGNLEFQAIKIARNLLSEPTQQKTKLKHFSLAAGLGMCCGGVVELLFETLGNSDLIWLNNLLEDQEVEQTSILVTELNEQECLKRLVTQSELLKESINMPSKIKSTALNMCINNIENTLIKGSNRLFYLELINKNINHLYLFGAGHVGQAIVKTMIDLDWQITWVDTRDDCLEEAFLNQLPQYVTLYITDSPESEIALAKSDAYFLVMTHDHALDLVLCEQILKRNDSRYFGVIGSQTKRKRFEHRLKAKGFTKEKIKTMICPIGIDGINSKHATSIAVSVVAQLLQQKEQQSNINHNKVTA